MPPTMPAEIPKTVPVTIRRLGPADHAVARELFVLMARVFDEECEPLGDAHLHTLLARAEFWAVGAWLGGELVGGVTAHALPMTRSESWELFIYDLAVRADRQRRGVGRALVSGLRGLARDAGIDEVFVPADDEDGHALEFYRAIGGEPGAVTIFSFHRP